MTPLSHEGTPDPALLQRVEELRRRVAWQVSAAYGLPLDEPGPAPPEPPPPRLPAAQPPAAAEPAPPERGEAPLPTLPELERLVARGAAAYPDRVDEWHWYLFYLRDFAAVDGSLSQSFRLLLETAFGPLLGSAQPVQVGIQ